MNDLKTNEKETRKRRLKEKISKLKELRSRYGQKMTIARLKKMKGFEKISDKNAKEVLAQLEEYARIALTQINRLNIKKQTI